jgi:hypothetical protein
MHKALHNECIELLETRIVERLVVHTPAHTVRINLMHGVHILPLKICAKYAHYMRVMQASILGRYS